MLSVVQVRDPSQLASVLFALAPHSGAVGPDQLQKTFRSSQVALSVRSLVSMPDQKSATAELPVVMGACVAFSGRLDNRQALCSALGVSEQALTISNSRLLGLAYQRWGRDCVKQFVGDWAFAIWDESHQSLFIARDACGRSCLYYYYDKISGLFVCDTQLTSLLAVSDVPKQLYEPYLVQHARGVPRGEATPYAGINRLLPGCALYLNKSGCTLSRYWNVAELPEITYPSDHDYVDRFRELFDEAVRCRIPKEDSVGAFLSGGLDSSSVVVTAAQMASRITSYTSVPALPFGGYLSGRQLGDESLLAKSVVSGHRNISPQWAAAEGFPVLQSVLAAMDICGEPLGGMNLYWFIDIMSRARSDGVKVLLSGEGGNATISYAGLARESSRVNLWHRLKGVRQAWLHRKSFDLADSYSVIAPRFSEDVRRLRKANLERVDSNEQVQFTDRLLRSGQMSIPHNLFAYHGVENRDPTMDQRLVEFCVGIPREQYYNGKQFKWLLNRAMAERLPREVLSQRGKGSQAADAVPRLLTELSTIDELLGQIESSPLCRHCLDVPKLRALRNELVVHRPSPMARLRAAGLVRGLQLGVLVRKFD